MPTSQARLVVLLMLYERRSRSIVLVAPTRVRRPRPTRRPAPALATASSPRTPLAGGPWRSETGLLVQTRARSRSRRALRHDAQRDREHLDSSTRPDRRVKL